MVELLLCIYSLRRVSSLAQFEVIHDYFSSRKVFTVNEKKSSEQFSCMVIVLCKLNQVSYVEKEIKKRHLLTKKSTERTKLRIENDWR